MAFMPGFSVSPQAVSVGVESVSFAVEVYADAVTSIELDGWVQLDTAMIAKKAMTK